MIRLFQSPILNSWIVHTIPDNTDLTLIPFNDEWYKHDRYYVHKTDINNTDIPIKKKRGKKK